MNTGRRERLQVQNIKEDIGYVIVKKTGKITCRIIGKKEIAGVNTVLQNLAKEKVVPERE
jgi:hypothetical protein